MIDAIQAVQIAKEQALHMLGQSSATLEEIEKETHKDREVWSITLSYPRDLSHLSSIARIGIEPLQYASSEEFVGKLRLGEFAK
jgi:hypothetical protein